MRFKIFDCYFLDINPDTHRITIVSVKRRVEKVLRPVIKSGMSYYRLYQNGVSIQFSLAELVSKNETFTDFSHVSHKFEQFLNEEN